MENTSDNATRDYELVPEPVETSVIKKEIRIDLIYASLKRSRRKYILPLVITFIVSCLLIIGVPRTYTVKVMLAPETTGSSIGSSSGLGSLASMAGLNLNSLNSTDAIIPMFYPDLMKSTDFIVPLLDAKVQTKKGNFKGTLAEYYQKEYKSFWLMRIVGSIIERIKKEDKGSLTFNNQGKYVIDPFQLNKKQRELVDMVINDISCTVDKKTDVITITTTSQDPIVAAQLADTVKIQLQNFITEYRTRKARNDYNHYKELYEKSISDYKKKQEEYSVYADANTDVVLPSYKVKEETLENEMQMAYNAYSTLKQQLQLAESKVTENTPAFTTLQNASVPLKPSGPKRMIFVAACLFLCLIVTSVYIVLKDKSLKA